MVGGVEGHGDSLAAGGGDWEGLKVASNHINYHLETCGGSEMDQWVGIIQ